MCRARRAGRCVPQPHARPHRVPVRVLDAIYVHVRDDALGQVVSERSSWPPASPPRAAVSARRRCRRLRGRDILDGVPALVEGRGLSGARLVITDAHEGLRAPIRKNLRGSAAACTSCGEPDGAGPQGRSKDGRCGVPVDLRADHPRGRFRRHASPPLRGTHTVLLDARRHGEPSEARAVPFRGPRQDQSQVAGLARPFHALGQCCVP